MHGEAGSVRFLAIWATQAAFGWEEIPGLVRGRPGPRLADPSYFLAMRVLYQRRPEKCSLRTLFSSWRYSISACWSLLTHPDVKRIMKRRKSDMARRIAESGG